ncbi:twin-arginine translocation pathway signal, partial [Diplocarpon rosae]
HPTDLGSRGRRLHRQLPGAARRAQVHLHGGFAKFQDSDFAALGLAPAEITNLKSIQGTEATHVTTLTSAISGAGTAPVQPCTYNFASAFTDAKTMIQVTSTATGGTSCAFLNGGLPGGAAFTPFANGACTVPQNLAGVTYLHLANSTPADGVLTDAITVAGPMVMTVT